MIFNKLFTTGWNIAYKNKNESEYTIIKNNVDCWVADPFLFEKDNKLYIFAEMYKFNRMKGSIGYCQIENGKESKWKEIIHEDYHLSFPNVIEENEEIYLYPESSENNNFYRYKCIEFPDKWIKDKEYISDIKLVDTVFWDYDGKKYGFTYNITNEQEKKLELIEISKHKINRLKKLTSEDEFARPAGNVLIKNNKKIRVSQDCKEYYGKALNFMEFELDDKINYKESLLKKVTINDIKLKNKNIYHGVHTYNESLNYQTIDLKFRKLLLCAIFYKVIRKIRGKGYGKNK